MAAKHKRGLIRSAKNERMRQQARRLLSKGLLVPSEAAKLAGVSRVLMHLWTKDIDWRAARARSLERAWRNRTRSGSIAVASEGSCARKL
jgi:hypothetical protein